jgi:site-specific DNA recombinase
MRAVGYFRVSTAGQAEDGVSLRAQSERYGRWCADHGVAESHGFTDAVSGKRSDNRPGLKGALAEVCRPPAGVLVVYSLSRLARSVKDTLAIAERLERAGAHLVSLTESIDTTTPMGRAFFQITAVLAELERGLIAERTRGIMADKRGRGERLGQIPYGKRLAADGVTLEDDPGERAIVKHARALHRDGASTREVARQLQQLWPDRTKNGGRWSKTTVGRLIDRGASYDVSEEEAAGDAG